MTTLWVNSGAFVTASARLGATGVKAARPTSRVVRLRPAPGLVPAAAAGVAVARLPTTSVPAPMAPPLRRDRRARAPSTRSRIAGLALSLGTGASQALLQR